MFARLCLLSILSMGAFAAPAFGKIASFALPYMRIPPQ